jgi:D-sedoheptulose 7-phosphate isomerase
VGLHVCGDHRQTLPALSARVQALLPDEVTDRSPATVDPRESLAVDHPRAAQALQELMDRHPRMQPCGSALAQAFRAVEQAQRCGGTLFACGNGGSFADAQHIAGELDKSMSLPRPLPQAHRTRLAPTGLDRCLEAGLRTVALGSNPALSTAVANDIDHPALVFAQELYALARPGDVLLGLTTRGRSRNVLAACQVGQTLGVTTVAISGGDGGPVAQHADVAVLAPGASTPEIQESHRLLYHALCDMLEREAFGR